MIPKTSHSALVDLPEAILLFSLIVLLIAEHIFGERFLSEQLDQGLRGGLTTLVSMMVWRIGARVLPSSPTRPRPRTPRARGNTIIRDRGVLVVLALLLCACGWSRETRETKRADAKAAGVELAACAVDRGASCTGETVALTVCFIEHGLNCTTERKTWARCFEAQALACGLPAVVALGEVLVHGAVDVDAPPENECARDAADRCADNAGDAAAVEACLAESLVPCVD